MTRIERRSTLAELEERTVEGQREMAAADAEVRAGHLLSKAFRLSGMSQRDLADRLGVTEGRVSQVLNADGGLKVSTIARYLRVMGYLMEIDAVPTDSSIPSLQPRRSPRKKPLTVKVFTSDSMSDGNYMVLTNRTDLDSLDTSIMTLSGHVSALRGDFHKEDSSGVGFGESRQKFHWDITTGS